jgi:hypothetical protein
MPFIVPILLFAGVAFSATATDSLLTRQRQIADSLSMLATVAPTQKNPMQKKLIWQKASSFYEEYVKNDKAVQSLGEASQNIKTVQNLYEFIKTDYLHYCTRQKVYWKNFESYGSRILYQKLSGVITLEPGPCENGLQISVLDSEIQCEYKSTVGSHLCSFRPNLKGESCSGEVYFLLALNPVLSFSSKTARAAEKTLEAKIRNNDFSEWKQELKKWVSTCIE